MPWRPAVHAIAQLAIPTVHAETLPVNTELAPPAALPQGSCSTASAPPGQHGIMICWTASASSTVTGYNVYSATTSGGPYTKQTSAPVPTGTNTFFFPTPNLGGVKEFIVVRSTDGVTESVNSNEISATAIGNPLPPTAVQAVSI